MSLTFAFTVPRPYRVPFGTVGCVLVFIPPVVVIVAILLLARYHTMLVGLITVIVACVTWLCFAKRIFKNRDISSSLKQEHYDASSLKNESTPMKDDSDVI